MSQDLFFSEILFFVIFVIAFMVSREFKLSKNGILRKLMIWYFATECFVYVSSGAYFFLFENGITTLNIHLFRYLVLIPKATMMVRILYYLKTKK